ncbi:MAG: hypothetical protein WCS42_08300 [Verrucomicrobiota bacterium]
MQNATPTNFKIGFQMFQNLRPMEKHDAGNFYIGQKAVALPIFDCPNRDLQLRRQFPLGEHLVLRNIIRQRRAPPRVFCGVVAIHDACLLIAVDSAILSLGQKSAPAGRSTWRPALC